MGHNNMQDNANGRSYGLGYDIGDKMSQQKSSHSSTTHPEIVHLKQHVAFYVKVDWSA